MRRTLAPLLGLGLVGVVGISCGQSEGIITVPLGFSITEGLLELSEADPTVGTVILAEYNGNCPAFQAGLDFTQIASSDFLTFNLQINGPDGGYEDGGYLPLTAGTYEIVMSSPATAGMYAASVEYETQNGCASGSITGANSGTVTVDPFNHSGASDVTWSVVFGLNRFVGSYALQTCVVPAGVGTDAGVCLPPGL